MDEAVKPDAVNQGEEIAVGGFLKAVKETAEIKSTVFGPDDQTLVARQRELQRQKVELLRSERP